MLNADGNNALWLACVEKHLALIDLLLDAGIDIDNCNDNGATALMYVASSGRTDVVAHLLARGADIKPETLDGFSALDMAANIDCLNLLRSAHKKRAWPKSAPKRKIPDPRKSDRGSGSKILDDQRWRTTARRSTRLPPLRWVSTISSMSSVALGAYHTPSG